MRAALARWVVATAFASAGTMVIVPAASAQRAAVHTVTVSGARGSEPSLLRTAAPAGATTIQHGPTCTDSWKAAASGSWATGSNWSNGVPPTSSDNACITVAGTYTVTVQDSQTAGTLTLGGSSGTQTLLAQANPGHNATLTLGTATGSSVGTDGVFELDTPASGGYAGLLGGKGITLINDGLFETLNDGTNTSYIETNLVNDSDGQVTLGSANTHQDDGTTTTNNGALTVAAAGSLQLSAQSSLTNNGTITDTGSLTLNNSTFTQSGGSVGGTAVALSNSSSLVDSAGAGSFTLTDNESLSGTVPSGQTVTAIAPSGHNASLSLASPGVTNDGTLALDSQASGGYALMSGSMLTNHGTFETLGGTTNDDYIQAPVTNSSGATISIQAPNSLQNDGTNTTNNGALTVAAAGSLQLSAQSSLTNNGTITDTGSLTLNNSTFTQSGGSVGGTAVALSNSSSLVDSAGAGSFTLTDNESLSGTIPSGQTVTAIAPSGHNASLSLASPGVTNDGTLALDSQANGGYALVSGSPLTNNGTLETLDGTTNDDYIRTPLTNDKGATINIQAPNSHQDTGTTTTNNGTLTVASGDTLALSAQSSLTNNGTITDTGSLTLNNSTFTQSGGSVGGTAVALSNSSSLVDSAGAGSFTLTDNESLSGTIPSGQTVTAIAPSGHNASLSLASPGVTNDGTLALDSQANGGYALVSGSPLTNNGTFETLDGTTNDDYIRAAVTNDKGATINIQAPNSHQDTGTTTSNNGTLAVGDGDGLALSGGSALVQGSTGSFVPTVDATKGGFGITGGTVTLGGTLGAVTVGTPTLGKVFTVLSGATVSGTFGGFNFEAHAYNVSVGPTAVTLTTATPFTLKGGRKGTVKEGKPFANIPVAGYTPGSQPSPVYSATINWGDGSTPSAGTVTSTSVLGGHTYTKTGTFTVSVTLSDQYGTIETVTDTATVVAGTATASGAMPSKGT